MAERTKLRIAAAMKRLLVKNPLDMIRITETCREAVIERPALRSERERNKAGRLMNQKKETDL